ncbi:MAG: winged helix-turn-helix transcriptional regulator [Muricauda sp.]|nr:winged helix-turn-helix transcriptional regulator [Allomuricauda sp.]
MKCKKMQLFKPKGRLWTKVIAFLYGGTFLLMLAFSFSSFSPNDDEKTFSSLAKIGLRNAGNTLLLQNNDSTSLVLPVVELEKNNFRLSFEKELVIVPDSLVSAIHKNFMALGLPNEYLVEVMLCDSKKVSYSYSISNNEEKNIIPCLGRNLPLDCYTINVLINRDSLLLGISLGLFLYAWLILGAFAMLLFYYSKISRTSESQDTLAYATIGDYRFYREQNKLEKNGKNVQLTSKESELLQIFCDNQNHVVKRDLLIKKVWEDKGVFVDRSLDTFISKLRKKFKDDNRINLLNVHGVGYKLEIVKKSRR